MNNLSESELSDAAEAISMIEQIGRLDDGNLQKIETLEREILYRKFYFPGGTAKLKVQDNNEDSDLFTKWDPRYIQEYIISAQQNGFHRWFLYHDGSEIKQANFTDAYVTFLECVDFENYKFPFKSSCNSDTPYGMMAGLIYFDKVQSFIDEYGENLGCTEKSFSNASAKGNNKISVYLSKISSFIGQTEKNFKYNDIGYTVRDDKLSFAGDLTGEMEKHKREYEEYKTKIWNILSGVKALNLCTNKTSGVFVGGVTVTQQMQCVQRINEAIEKQQVEPETVPETVPEEEKIPESGTNQDDDVPNAESENQVTKKENNLWRNIIIFIISFVIVVIFVYVLYLYIRRKMISKAVEGFRQIVLD